MKDADYKECCYGDDKSEKVHKVKNDPFPALWAPFPRKGARGKYVFPIKGTGSVLIYIFNILAL